MTTTETTKHTLTADELKALRNADSVTFHHHAEGVLGEPNTYMLATKDVDPGDGFGKREMHVTIECIPKFTIYEKDQTSGRTQPTSAFWSRAGKYYPVWQTMIRQFKVGDEIILHWTGSNNSDRHRADGYSIDEFRIEIARTVTIKTRTKYEHLVFLLDVQACPPGGYRNIRFD